MGYVSLPEGKRIPVEGTQLKQPRGVTAFPFSYTLLKWLELKLDDSKSLHEKLGVSRNIPFKTCFVEGFPSNISG